MRKELERIYLEEDRRKRHLKALKNRYLAIIYKGVLERLPSRKIHKRLYDETISSKPQYADKFLLGLMIKTANKAKKLPQKDSGSLAAAIFALIWDGKVSDKAKKIINYDARKIAEQEKEGAINDFIAKSQASGKWLYLASSHDDCAKDHLPYQGKLYADENAPEEVAEYAKARGIKSLQWVLGSPAWFVTRPNCRHYFVALTLDEVRKKPLKKLMRKHKMHTKEGDRTFQTPRRAAIEEYEDKLRMLRALYREKPIERIEKEIQKAEILLKKWKNAI